MKALRVPLIGLLVAIVGLAQTITVFVVNAKTGKPVKGEIVTVLMGTTDEPNFVLPGRISLHSKTDQDGKAIVNLGETHVKTIYVLDDSGISTHCSDAEMSLEVIRTTGLLAKGRCGVDHKLKAIPEPGKVTLFIKHLGWWQRGKT